MILIKVESWNALLRNLPVYIGICVKSVLRYKFVILDIVHIQSDTKRGELLKNPNKN